jgi:thymidylate kinase
MIFKLFDYLKKNNYNFCIINGYQEIIEQKVIENDNDILFKQNDFKNINKIIKNFCVENDFYIIQMMNHDIWAKNFFIYNPKNEDLLNLDLYGELSRKGIIFFDETDIFTTLHSYKSIPILSPEKEFINYLVKKLDKKDLTEQNFEHLYKLYFDAQELSDSKLKILFPRENKLIKRYFINNDFFGMKKDESKIIKDFYTLKNNNISRKVTNYFRIIKRIEKPTGLTVAFLGPDGSGKSTIIDTLLEKQLPFRRKDYFHLKPIVTNESKSVTVDEPHLKPVYLPLKSYIKLLYFIYQYNFGWMKNIVKLKIKSSLVIFDRYFDDILVDYKRYRYGGSLKVAKFARFFIPKPDLYFILTADADVIYKRKQEVPFEELERQVKKYRELADGKRYFSIDVNRTPQEISKEIITIMMEKMNERY